ncbi:hypothetical protein GCM10022237_48130 [Nocardioides ginsengisoli]
MAAIDPIGAVKATWQERHGRRMVVLNETRRDPATVELDTDKESDDVQPQPPVPLSQCRRLLPRPRHR